MPPNKAAAGRKRDVIHFVNARPSSETERVRIRHLVRAHVGQWISDQTKDRSDPADTQFNGPHEKAVDLDAEESLFPSSSPSRRSSSHSSESNAPVSNSLVRSAERKNGRQTTPIARACPVHNDVVVGQFDRNYDQNQMVRGSMSLSNSPSPPPPGDYVETLGANVLDPFHTSPSKYAPDLVNACLNVLWPGLTPGHGSDDSSVLASSNWFPLSLNDPTLFTAFLFGSLSHQRVQWINGWIPEGAFRPRDQQLLQLCEFETIKMINHQVSIPGRAVCDAVILSVICMAHNVADEDDKRRQRRTPFHAPMRRLQWLDVYGSLPPNIIHVAGLVQMVKLRGGLEQITLPGLAPVLSFSDIVTATTYLVPPTFSYIPLCDDRRNVPLQTLLGYDAMDVERHYGHLRQLGLTEELLNLFYAMRLYMNNVDAILRKTMKCDDALIADQRNLIQYTLQALPPASQIEGYPSYPDQGIVYEATRLAAIVYSVGVVFPLPAQSSPLAQLSLFLRGTVGTWRSSSTWANPQALALILWVLTLGGIASDNRPEREWFVQVLGQTLRDHHISTWAELRTMLKMVLWYDSACDEAGRNLLFEIEMAFMSF
ncbi:hypothetical protein P170DRAFT_422549 [Aspergillus steynii IBT 23096]|uniref:Uncharacterized protein n=1 Tax=Aspergillus steynii IBT 23096 TaxID=1392250 RepID=A0A2I2GF85_9EURO|nr:uncharacterized protein P170DRAFT_422549 [Aspergillus steynii IBT 23096]PLB51540.1 hypothetical protein P170DRAFT_422549 [Aspergillus steynii IBT 23096]